jgi:xanthine dehydrogenase YagS FAD-binding subunit
MITFQYVRPDSLANPVSLMADDPTAKFIAGGTNLIDLMKMDVERPTKLIDISRLALDKVEETPEGGLRIGALVRTDALGGFRRLLDVVLGLSRDVD